MEKPLIKKDDKPPAEPRHSSRKVKNSFIDLEPVAGPLKESHSALIDQLIRAGMGDIGQMSLYRRAIENPREAVNNPQLRGPISEVVSRVIDLVLEDRDLFLRLRTLLERRGRHHFGEGIDPVVEAMRLRTEARDPEAVIQPNKTDTRRKRHPRKTESPGP